MYKVNKGDAGRIMGAAKYFFDKIHAPNRDKDKMFDRAIDIGGARVTPNHLLHVIMSLFTGAIEIL